MTQPAMKLVTEEFETSREWIKRAREAFSPGERQPCAVCGKYASLAHAHHVTPLTYQYERGAKDANHEHVWLCPTHHAAIHILIAHMNSDQTRLATKARMRVTFDLATSEPDALASLSEIAGRAFQ